MVMMALMAGTDYARAMMLAMTYFNDFDGVDVDGVDVGNDIFQ